jgi:uncharacterized membrane protein YdjX (TVP38/TMEM64 family)
MQNAPQTEPAPTSRGPIIAVALFGIVMTAIGLLVLYAFGLDGITGWVMESWRFLQDAPPIVFFGAMSLLTIFPVPVTPFYVTAGSLYGILPSLLWIPPAIVLNNFIAYTLTTTFLRPWLQSIVSKRGYSIPSLETKREQTLFITMVRITPGPPYFLQSLVLGLAGVDRLRFLVLSLPLHMIFVIGFVVLGRSAFDGEFGLAIAAITLILGASILARLAHKHLTAISEPDSDSDSESAPTAD